MALRTHWSLGPDASLSFVCFYAPVGWLTLLPQLCICNLYQRSDRIGVWIPPLGALSHLNPWWPLPPSRRILKAARCRKPPWISAEAVHLPPPSIPPSLCGPLQHPTMVFALHEGNPRRFYERECVCPGDGIREGKVRDRQGDEIGAERVVGQLEPQALLMGRWSQMSGALCVRDQGAC